MLDIAYSCIHDYAHAIKPVVWLGTSKADLKAFPATAMDDMGHQLFRVQCGLDPDDWKPMASIGAGVREIRVRDPSGAFRTIYLATRPEAIYVLHCFRKKTPKTARQDIDLARQRLARVPRRAPHG
jgi:phage-related protein